VLASLLGLWVVGTIGVRLEQTVGVPIEAGLEIERALVRALTARLGGDVAIDSPDWAPCEAADTGCIDALRARMHADSVLLLRMFGAPTAIRLVAKLFGPSGSPTSTELDLDPSSATWPAAFERLAKELFPSVDKPAPRVVIEEPRAKEPKGWVALAPWAAFGVSVVCAGLGAYFGVQSSHSKEQLDALLPPLMVQPEPTVRPIQQDHESQTIVAYALVSVAIAGAITGAIFILAGD
jgi:hypothetical protein